MRLGWRPLKPPAHARQPILHLLFLSGIPRVMLEGKRKRVVKLHLLFNAALGSQGVQCSFRICFLSCNGFTATLPTYEV